MHVTLMWTECRPILDLEFSILESWSRDPIFKVLVLVLMPVLPVRVLVLVLTLELLSLESTPVVGGVN